MIREGSEVTWKWGNGEAKGKVIETYTSTVTKTIKGTEITRNGQSGNKALLIRSDDNDDVLKLESEVSHIIQD